VIAEAIDTVLTLGWALAAWIVLVSLAAALALHAVLAIVWWACRTAWRGVAGARSAVQRLKALIPHPEPRKPSRAHTAPRSRPAPSWARTDHHYKEAA
jgi:hypothetical protein